MLYLGFLGNFPARKVQQTAIGNVFISYFIYHVVISSINYWHSVDKVLFGAQNARFYFWRNRS